jgi:hypothetical protein
MDDRETPISLTELFRRDGADVAPGVRPSTDVEDRLSSPIPDPAGPWPAYPLREGSVDVYCGNARRVSEGFALALRAMGLEPGIS